jgi:hypothetical protein
MMQPLHVHVQWRGQLSVAGAGCGSVVVLLLLVSCV